MDLSFPYRAQAGLDALLGLVITAAGEDWITAEMPVRDDLKQPAGLVHGGVYAAIAETLASLATAVGVMPDGMTAQGLSNQTSFLRPILEGTIHARGQRRHRGRTTWVWDVEISDDAGRLCVVTRMTIAVRRPA